MMGRIFLGRYEVIRLLGEGGMGRVYLARQQDLGRQVVVKVMHDHVAADPKFRERFQRETLLMARFQHPYAVTLYDASLNDPQGPCIIMEYIKGITLDALRTRNGRLNPVRVTRLLDQLCEVLQAAHGEGIIHRDLKPANLMVVDPDTPYEKIKVMDFGLAKLIGSPQVPLAKLADSTAEFAIGTPAYMCPEQVRGDEMDHRGDLYSVGVILYELLTSRLPFDRSSTMDILLAHATDAPPSFGEIGAGDWVPKPIEDVILSCLAKFPADRPQSARELADRYHDALAQAQVARHQPPPALPSPPPGGGDTASSSGTGVVAPIITEQDAVVHQMEAWMPETIALYKLRGFVQDVGGQVLESVPGRIRVRLGGSGSKYQPTGPLSWLGVGRRSDLVDLELRMQQADPGRGSKLSITVLLRPVSSKVASDPRWRARCNQVYCDLRSYLMGGTAVQSH